MQPGDFVETRGDQPAVVMADTGEVVTYAELDERSKRLAQLWYAAGVRPGDHIAVLLENHSRYFEIYWASQRSGLFFTPINWHLTAEEAGYIVVDCGARILVTSDHLRHLIVGLEPFLDGVDIRLVIGGEIDTFVRYETAIAAHPAEPLQQEVEGTFMFYSSGTTGKPKGIKPPLDTEPFGASTPMLVSMIQGVYGFSAESVYLCPAPLYHAAPLGWATAVQRIGGQVVVMAKFDAADALAAIEKYAVTHAQFVPTHFVRMLKLPADEREAHDLSTLTTAVHAAAPCPIDVKQQMIDWWGPIIFEYYAGSEGNGFCAISSAEWLEHVGSVGRPLLGIIHILDDDGEELPVEKEGQIWFESPTRFEYHNDPVRTAAAFNERGWSSLGDIGYVDDDGFLYLTDRVSHMIISGGVNIYPQEVENELTMHPKVADVAVIGVPNLEMGEEVKAVVIPAPGIDGDPSLETELIEFTRNRLAHYKCPRSVDFVDELPRLPTGKLLKRKLRDRYQAE